MRRFLIICFLSLMIFRSVGYIFTVAIFQCLIDIKVKELVETHASQMGGSLIFTTPATVLNGNESSEYSPIDGKITFEGIEYRMVKQKVYHNLQYIVCVKDDHEKSWMANINEIIAGAAGQSMKDVNSLLAKILGSLIKYYSLSAHTGNRSCCGWGRTIDAVVLTNFYSFTIDRALFHPPDEFIHTTYAI